MSLLKNIPKEKRQKIAHALAGTTILIHAYEKWLHHSGTSWIFLFFGVLVFILIAFHERLHHRYPGIDAVFFFIEGVLMFVTAYYYFTHDKKYLPYCYLLTGIFYVGLTLYRHKKSKAEGHAG